MAFSSDIKDPCSLLNNTSYADLWLADSRIPAETVTDTLTPKRFELIATDGTPKTFGNSLPNTKTENTLKTPDTNSSSRLIQFMSGGGNAGAGYSSLDSILLKKANTTIETIIDTYIISSDGLNKTTYNTSYETSLTDTELGSIITKLKENGHLLTQNEIYNTTATAGQESLIYLYRLDIEKKLTTVQKTRLVKLEAKNLKFFAAFLAEYCFYKTRYIALVKNFFSIYSSTTFSVTSTNTAHSPLFTSVPTSIEKADVLGVLVKHMAYLQTKLTDLTNLLNAINNDYSGILSTIQTTLNSSSDVGSNTRLTTTISSLNSSALKANKLLSQMDYSKGVVEYTEEKNRYANVLLGLYTFLNISALAMVIHLYKS
jgi:hypothetical protein